MELSTPEGAGVTWAPPPDPDAIEWTGTAIGGGNTITRTRARTAVHDKRLDANPGRRDALIERAREFASGGEPCFTHDVVIHGIRVRATTNMAHLIDFWRENWFSVEEWERSTGRPAAGQPGVLVYAMGHVPDEQEAAYYSRERNTIVFFNTSYYGQLKSWVLGAVGRILAEDFGIHSIHGAAVDAGGDRGVLFIAPTGTGKSTSSYGLMELPEAVFHSDDWVYVRYAVRLRNGAAVSPYRARLPGVEVRGFEVLPWLRSGSSRGATVHGLTLDDRHWVFAREDIDWAAGLAAYAYISEKRFYLRSNLVESFPSAAPAILRSRLENVPDATPALLQRFAPAIRAAAAELDGTLGSHDQVEAALARLVAFDNARAMLDIAGVFGPQRVFSSPLRPLRLRSVVLLRRDRDDPTVLRRLERDQFIERLACGRTPDGKYETAYNAYRAVDDGAERAYIEQLVASGDSLLALTGQEAPVTLREEFTLFRAMFAATACWDLNTVLAQDPEVSGTREAVERTVRLLERVVEGGAAPLLTLADYRPYALPVAISA